jgi:hypothetical protein
MGEVAGDWNYEKPGIQVKALSFFARATRAKFFGRNVPLQASRGIAVDRSQRSRVCAGVARTRKRLESAFISLPTKRFS